MSRVTGRRTAVYATSTTEWYTRIRDDERSPPPPPPAVAVMTRGPIIATDGLLLKSLLFACCSLLQLQATAPPLPAAFVSSATNVTDTVPVRRWPLEILTAVIMPADPEYPTSLSKVMPVLEIAVRDLYTKGVLRETDVTFKFVQRDDKCEDIEALRSSFELNVNGHVDLFLGPTCDYGVDLVARMIKFWNAPLLTTGAIANDFSSNKQDPKSKYFLLVRTGLLDFQDVADMVVNVLQKYSWKHVLLVYEIEGYSKVSGKQSCSLMTKTLVESFKGEAGIQYDAFDLSKNPQNNLTENLRIEASNKYSSKRFITYSF
ncbi:Periplasmic binding protein-like I,Receptor, ligand binding region [Cinara cedri]|uniref:Periplasmic binding protein-like I,Receptor, ligand binding region n=1 Tax=Cinara cedri TaxID=506608 RepID=A0A5E4MMP4_9HEMI|nr:Periplasmic binding protein-like I,Receptor, ligand binding region [Cinara cedri]